MSVPVSTTVEGHGLPSEYKSGEMNSMAGDGGHERKVAFITGTTGQDGSYLVELLLEKGYIVHGIKRRSSSYNHPRLEHIMEEGTWSFGGIRDLCICTVFLSHPFARALDRCTEADPVV